MTLCSLLCYVSPRTVHAFIIFYEQVFAKSLISDESNDQWLYDSMEFQMSYGWMKALPPLDETIMA